MKIFIYILTFGLLSLAACTSSEEFPPEGYVHIYATIEKEPNDSIFTEKALPDAYLKHIDPTTFSIYYYYTRTGVLCGMPSGYENPKQLEEWGEQDATSLYEDTYDIIVANVDPYKYDIYTDKYLPTLNPRRGVKFISRVQTRTIVADKLYPIDYIKISQKTEQDWNLQTAIINVRARDTVSTNDFNALHSYQVFVGNLLFADTDLSNDLVPYSPKRITVGGVQGYMHPLRKGESYDVRILYSADGITTKTAVLHSAINDVLKAGVEVTIILEKVDDEFGMVIQSPDGDTSHTGDIEFS